MGNICEDQQVKSLEVIRYRDKDKFQSKFGKKKLPENPSQDLPESFQTHEHEVRPKKNKTNRSPLPELNEKVRKVLDKERLANPISGVNVDTFPVHYLEQKEAHYQGHWYKSQPHGKGAIYFKTGAYFEGQLIQGEVECSDGLLVLVDGSYYRGSFSKSLFQGTGIFVSTLGTIYEGQWLEGVPSGKGKQKFSDGNCYEGEFHNGKKQGQGVFKWSDGRVYEGQFKNGMMHGRGKFYIGDQECFDGEFFQNRKIGQNKKLKTAQGTYTGTFQNDMIRGKFEWKDQTVYEGEFKNGLPHGEGTLIYPQGRILEGTWEEGKNVKIKEVKSNLRPKSRSRTSIK